MVVSVLKAIQMVMRQKVAAVGGLLKDEGAGATFNKVPELVSSEQKVKGGEQVIVSSRRASWVKIKDLRGRVEGCEMGQED